MVKALVSSATFDCNFPHRLWLTPKNSHKRFLHPKQNGPLHLGQIHRHRLTILMNFLRKKSLLLVVLSQLDIKSAWMLNCSKGALPVSYPTYQGLFLVFSMNFKFIWEQFKEALAKVHSVLWLMISCRWSLDSGLRRDTQERSCQQSELWLPKLLPQKATALVRSISQGCGFVRC